MSSSSSEDGTPLQQLQFSGASVLNPFLDDSPAQEKRLQGFESKLLDALENKRKDANYAYKSDNVVQDKGKAKLLNETECQDTASQIDSQMRFALNLPQLSALKVSARISLTKFLIDTHGRHSSTMSPMENSRSRD